MGAGLRRQRLLLILPPYLLWCNSGSVRFFHKKSSKNCPPGSEVSFWSNFCGNYSGTLSENPVIFVMVNWMCNQSLTPPFASLRLCVKLITRRCKVAKNKSHPVSDSCFVSIGRSYVHCRIAHYTKVSFTPIYVPMCPDGFLYDPYSVYISNDRIPILLKNVSSVTNSWSWAILNFACNGKSDPHGWADSICQSQ